MINYLKKLFSKTKLEQLSQLECSMAIRWVSSAHERLMDIQWHLPPQPEHFDHHIDLFYQWRESRNPAWLERGIFSSLALKGGNVLELSCGDGFNARNFYSLRSNHITACDFDPKAIETARQKNNAPNINFVLADIRTSMPAGTFENIIWDGAMEHFTVSEIELIIANIKSRLTGEGIFSGYTIVEQPEGKALTHHEYEFQSKEDLLRFLTPHFKNVSVFETFDPSRHNLYFWASDGVIPFAPAWNKQIISFQE